jgi:hypothetical protein
MAIRIFDVDPDARPKKRFQDDIVGRFRSGAQVNGRPLALEEWRITTGDPAVAERVQDLYGGQDAQTWVTQGEDNLEVYTTTSSVAVLLDGPGAIRSGMALWGRNGLIHSCDGETTTDGDPCPMAGKTVADRKDAAKAGYGCEPSIQVYFRLADDEDLGKFRFFSGSWSLAGEIADAEAALEKIGGPARGTLTLEVVEFTTKAGAHRRFTKPVVTVTGPA